MLFWHTKVKIIFLKWNLIQLHADLQEKDKVHGSAIQELV